MTGVLKLCAETEELAAQIYRELERLMVAVELENDFHKIHASYSLLFKDPTMKKMFAARARADQLHVVDLYQHLRDYKAVQSSGHDGTTGG